MEFWIRARGGKLNLGFGDDDLLHSLQRLDGVPEVDDEVVGDGGERVGGDLLLDVLVRRLHRRRGVLVEVLGLRTQLSGR